MATEYWCDAIKSAWAKIPVEGFQRLVELVHEGTEGCLSGKKQWCLSKESSGNILISCHIVVQFYKKDELNWFIIMCSLFWL